jgi:plasmid stabilization system protein ParE
MEATQYIAQTLKSAAARWQAGLWEKIFSLLPNMPEKFGFISEADELRFPLRSFNYHSHRVVYRVDDASSTVFVVRVYHGARQDLKEPDIEE